MTQQFSLLIYCPENSDYSIDSFLLKRPYCVSVILFSYRGDNLHNCILRRLNVGTYYGVFA